LVELCVVWATGSKQSYPFAIHFKDLEPSVPLTPALQRKRGASNVWSPEEYEKCAAECLRWSRIVTNVQSKAMLVQMAATWIKLAERVRAKAEKEAA